MNRSFRAGAGRWLAVIAAFAIALPGEAMASPAPPTEAAPPAQGFNPHPVHVTAPAAGPLSAMAQLGRKLFNDPNLSGSGRLSCASCHDPAHAYGPRGGADTPTPGVRAVPSLGYLYRQPAFSLLADRPGSSDPGDEESGDNDAKATFDRAAQPAAAEAHPPQAATAGQAASARGVARGGLYWDGRANTVQQQTNGPLYDPAQMAARGPAEVAGQIAKASYAQDFRLLFGPSIFNTPTRLIDEAMFAIARYQLEEPGFHPYTSKFDSWLAGRARFTPAEMRGYLAFNDARKGNCAACHLDQPTQDGLAPLFTDHRYEALGVPRNPAIPANRDPAYYDLGLCGPYRTDLRDQARYCGMFRTPSLRNTATRKVYFHNGRFHSLAEVLDWYAHRDLEPERFYSRDADGAVVKYDDLPARYRGNVDTRDAPFDRRPGDAPALSRQDISDIIAFLGTLNDGYAGRPGQAPSAK